MDTRNYKDLKVLLSLYETINYKGSKALLSLYETMTSIRTRRCCYHSTRHWPLQGPEGAVMTLTGPSNQYAADFYP